MNEIKVPISPGELLDKITILRIKSQRMSDPQKVQNVRAELAALQETWSSSAYARIDIAADIEALQTVNERLWVIEDDIRDKERAQAFDAEFIRLARAVYVENDERAAIKRRINVTLGSSIIEEKSYRPY
jgi:paraquat-inducible protein B